MSDNNCEKMSPVSSVDGPDKNRLLVTDVIPNYNLLVECRNESYGTYLKTRRLADKFEFDKIYKAVQLVLHTKIKIPTNLTESEKKSILVKASRRKLDGYIKTLVSEDYVLRLRYKTTGNKNLQAKHMGTSSAIKKLLAIHQSET